MKELFPCHSRRQSLPYGGVHCSFMPVTNRNGEFHQLPRPLIQRTTAIMTSLRELRECFPNFWELLAKTGKLLRSFFAHVCLEQWVRRLVS